MERASADSDGWMELFIPLSMCMADDENVG